MLRIAFLVFVLAAQAVSAAGLDWSVESPDGQCSIAVSLMAGGLRYEARHAGKTVVETSPIGLRRDDQNFEGGLTVDHIGVIEADRETYDLFAGTTPHVDHFLNRRSLWFRNTNSALMELDLAAGDEGVAFRYRFPENFGDVRVVESERTSFAVPKTARGWMQPYHAASEYTPAYEDFFFRVAPGDPPPNSRARAVGWAFPALFEEPEAGAWILLTEAGTGESYCACHLEPDCPGGVYRIAFPLADEETRHYTNEFGPEPRSTLPWKMPWRVIIMGKTAGDIATSTLVTDLSAPCRIEDTSWIKPGRASWGWWSYPEGPATEKMFDHFSDFAAKMKWEYTLFDAGWWEPGITNIARHAVSEGVMPLAWFHASDFYDDTRRKEKLDKMAAVGVRGVKVDFWCTDRQEAIAAQQALMREAADRHMIVNLHGCTIPRGWQRTWPNLLSTEAVLGDESYFFEPRYTEKAAELNTVLPFTRNVVGPMDVTPVAVSPKKYERTTTAAHELAAALIFTCGVIHYADRPEYFNSLPRRVLQVFRDAPARWDETKCLVGDPGRLAVFARRARASWFIAGINGTGEPQSVHLDLTAFADFPKRIVIGEAKNAKMDVIVSRLPEANEWTHEIPPRGGFILRMDK